jgi:PAS domain S-box-containing protein
MPEAHQRPEDPLMDPQAMLAAIVASSEDAIISKAPDGTVTSWNAAAERIFGYTANEAIGNSIAILFPDDQPNEETELLDSIVSGVHVSHYETVRVRKDGKHIDVSLTLSPIKDTSGRIIGVSKIVRDITSRKNADRALAEAQRRLREHATELEKVVAERTGKLRETISVLDSFCHTIAHDLRAPLRALSGFSRDLCETHTQQLDQEGREILGRIAAAACKMDQLILDLLRLGKISTEELTMETLSVEAVIRETQALLESEFQRTGARMRIIHPLHSVHGNRVLLGQILMNLIGNAIKFVPADRIPELQISSQLNGDYVRLSLKDNGIGIKPSHATKLFQPFLRLVKDHEYPGTGVGLAIVRKAAERMNGRVGVESELGKGSCFWIELPAA